MSIDWRNVRRPLEELVFDTHPNGKIQRTQQGRRDTRDSAPASPGGGM